MPLYRNIAGIGFTNLDNQEVNEGGTDGGAAYVDPVLGIPYAPPVPFAVVDVKEEPAVTVADTSGLGLTAIRAAVFEAGSRKLLFGATISLLKSDGSPVGPPVTLAEDSNTFTVYSNDPDTELLAIGKDGYTAMVLPVVILLDNPEVYLTKGAGNGLLLLGAGVGLLLYFKKKKRGVSGFDTGTVLTVSAGVLALKGFGLLDSLLDRLGLGKNPADSEESNPNSAFKPGYWQQFTTFPHGAITEDTARNYGAAIQNAFGLFSDNYNAILSVFTSLKSKAQVSFLAWEFNKQYAEDLLSFLTNGGGILPWDGLSSTHLRTIISLVNALPSN